MLTFTTPWAWLLAAPAVWLWLRRRHAAGSRVVPNLFLWTRRPGAVASAGATSRRVPPWLVWVQTAALLAIAAAASGPVTSPRRADAAVILDASMSTGAQSGAGVRLDQLRDTARQWLRAQRARARVRLIVAGRTAREAGDATGAESAFDGVAPDDGPADFAGAIAIARRATTGRIAVVADRPAPPAAATLGIEWIVAGKPVDNAGITYAVRTSPTELVVDVRNAGRATVDARLAAGAVMLPLRLAPGERRSVNLSIDGGDATRDVTVHLIAPDGNALAADDLRTLPAPRPVRVAVMPGVPAAATLAIRAIPGVAESAAPPDVTICVECASVAGPWIQVPGDGMAGGTPLRPLHIDAVDHALFDGVDPGGVNVRSVPMPGTADGRTGWVRLASADGAPVLDTEDAPGRRHVRVHADLGPGGLADHAVFPMLMANAVHWLAERPRDGISRADVERAAESDLLNAPAPETDTWRVAATSTAATRGWAWPLAILALLLAGVDAAVARRVTPRLVAGAVCLVAVVTEVRLPIGASPRTVIFAVDGSASAAGARPSAATSIRADLAAMPPGDTAGVVVFGGAPLDTRRPESAPAIDARRWPVPAAATNIESGLRAALALLPPSGDRRVVLLSDGHATAGDASSAVAALRAGGVPVDVVPLTARGLSIARVDAPPEARDGLPIDVQVDVVGPPGGRMEISLTRDGDAIGTQTVAADAQGRARVLWRDTPPRRGLIFYHASITDRQMGIALSEGGAAVNVTGPPAVLVVSMRASNVASRWPAGTRVTRMRPSAVPGRPAALDAFDAIVLDGVLPSEFTDDQRSALADSVAGRGAGLLFIGTARAGNAAGFAPSPLAELLPFDFSKAATPPARSRALALVVDTSGSMATTAGGIVKIAAAKDAITRALAVLPREDVVEVIGFAAQPAVLLPAGAPRDPGTIASALSTLQPRGSTAIAPAVAGAATFLSGTAAESRRLVLLSDGRTSPADIDATRQALAGRGIALSVVSTGDDESLGWLSQLARDTGGQTYTPASLQTLPDDVAQAALGGVTGRVIDAPFQARVADHALTAAMPPPSLGGYVSAERRPDANAVWRAPNGDAVLAAWSRGLGRVVALASDADGAWGRPLGTWPSNGAFWTRLLAWLSRASQGADADFLSTDDGARLVVVTPRPSGSAVPTVTAAIVDPLGRTVAVPLYAVTPTRHEALVTLERAGEYRAVIDVGGTRLSRGWFWSGDAEGRATGANQAALSALATRGGGRVGAPAPSASDVFTAPRARGAVPPAWWWLTLATAALVFEYARRRPSGGLT